MTGLRAPAGEGDEGTISRINVRMPESLKVGIEHAAEREGLSINAWLVRAAAARLERSEGIRGRERRAPHGAQRYSGWARWGGGDTGGTAMATFNTPEPISVDVELGVGDIRIEASVRTETAVEVRPSDPARKADVTAAEQTRVEFANGHLLVKTPSGWRHWMPHRGDGSIDVEIGLPEGSRVRGRGGRGCGARPRPARRV